jgi:hypothetical protein
MNEWANRPANSAWWRAFTVFTFFMEGFAQCSASMHLTARHRRRISTGPSLVSAVQNHLEEHRMFKSEESPCRVVRPGEAFKDKQE